jgi:hypothetical protein
MEMLQKKIPTTAMLSMPGESMLGKKQGSLGTSRRGGKGGAPGAGGVSTAGQLVWSFPLWTKAS